MSTEIPLETAACNLCGSDRFRVLFSGSDRQYSDVPADVTCSVVRCSDCGVVFLNPRVKQEHIGRFYPASEYYTRQPYQNGPGIGTRIKNDIYRTIARRYFGYPQENIRLESPYGGLALELASIIAYRLFSFRYRQLFPYIPGGRHLDFGFGAGSYLDRQHDLGWEAWGVEMDEHSVQRMNKKGVRAFTSLWDSRIPSNYFDLVTTYHSMEHLYDPKAVLYRMHEIIKPNGTIYMGVPSFDSFAGRVFRSYWYDLGIPIHPYIFTKQSVIKYVTGAGFKDIDIRYRSLTQGLLGSTQLVVNAGLGRLTGKKEVSMFLRDNLITQLLALPFAKALDLLSMGDRIEITARK